MELKEAIARLCDRRDLLADEMAASFGRLMDGEGSGAQVGAFLIALRMKGETVDELVGAARAMRERAARLRVPGGILVDTCGTGGDGRGTINISTVAALVAAAGGVRVAKHGNRASSSRAGSADLLEALGVRIDAPVEVVERCLAEVGFGFLYAPAFHVATRHVTPARRELAVRTVFNLLGPLTNPAGARHQVVGVYDPALLEPLARALGALGSERALVIHGAGLDEFSPDGPTEVAELHHGVVRRYRLTAGDFGLAEADSAGLRGGSAEDNAAAARAILSGAEGAARNCVVMSAAAGLYVAGLCELGAGARRAEALLDDGSAARLLDRLVALTRGAA